MAPYLHVFNNTGSFYRKHKRKYYGSFLPGFNPGKVVAVPEKSLGLDEVSFMQKIERKGDIGSRGLALVPPLAVPKSVSIQPDKGRSVFPGEKFKDIASRVHYGERKKRMVRFKDALVAGPAKNRIVLYRPGLPKASLLPSDFNFDYKVIIGFRISRHGFIESPECLLSSGSPHIDELAIRHIRGWQFMPLDEGLGSPPEGIVRVNLDVL